MTIPADRLVKVATEKERRADLWREGASSMRASGQWAEARIYDRWASDAEDFALRLRYMADCG